jgi:acyl dehydratase
MSRKYFEDLEVGQRFGGASYAVEREEMVAFARKWDPRPIHVDEEAGVAAGFGGVIASGAYTTAIFTLLSMRSRAQAGDHAVIAGLGAESRLPNPVRAGDTLTYRAEISAKRESGSRSDAGVVHTRARLTNQEGAVVYESETATLVEKRPPASGDRPHG